MTPALFVALEGIDGSGKSTQSRLLGECLTARGMSILTCADPGGTELGDRLRDVLLHQRGNMELVTEALLFMASRAELTTKVIRPALAAGQIVISDRFLLSNVAYQGHAAGLNPANIWDIGRFATQGLLPDVMIVLDLPVEEAAKRRKKTPDRMERRNDDYFRAVREGFLTEASHDPQRIKVVSGLLPIEEVSREICKIISDELGSRFGIKACKHLGAA